MSERSEVNNSDKKLSNNLNTEIKHNFPILPKLLNYGSGTMETSNSVQTSVFILLDDNISNFDNICKKYEQLSKMVDDRLKKIKLKRKQLSISPSFPTP